MGNINWVWLLIGMALGFLVLPKLHAMSGMKKSV